ncbi:MAG: DHA2 family efflux MFS transporter permease subunit [Heliobacteriaceae bacterium]|nr:DHA2 family efflux MFS transporter permease subunit [Heliobacteriaceae bacterium]
MTGGQQRGILVTTLVVVIGSFMAVLDSSILNVALPKLMVLFGVDTKQIEWLLTAYMLVSGSVIPITNYLGDTYGYKRLYTGSLIIFTFGSLLCSLGWSNNSLICFRIIQGIGGGLLMPTGMALLFKLIPREKIGVAMGLFGLSMAVAPSVGPTLGGFILDEYSWRWLFMINVPVGILGVTLCQAFLVETTRRAVHRFDGWGLALGSASAFLYLLALAKGQDWGWTSYPIVMLLLTATTLLAILIIVELDHPEPMINIRLFREPNFTYSVILSCGLAVILFTGVILVPIYLQNIRGYSAMETGLLLMPQALATGVMAPVAGKVFDKFGPRPLLLVGLPLMFYSNWQFYQLGLDTPDAVINRLMVLRGLGLGLTMMPITTAGVNAVPVRESGAASALNTLTRMIAGSFGIALVMTIMENRQFFHQHRLAENLDLFSPTWVMIQQVATGIFAATGDTTAAAPAGVSLLATQVQMHAATWAIADVFYLFAFGILLLTPVAFLLKKPANPAPELSGK